jgi:transaldolase/transaldolase/glucose-6-phosphate isomerase
MTHAHSPIKRTLHQNLSRILSLILSFLLVSLFAHHVAAKEKPVKRAAASTARPQKTQVQPPSSEETLQEEKIQEEMEKYLGVRYKRGGSSTKGFDCSGFVKQIYSEVFGSDRFKALEAKGAKPQRLLWASTGTKSKVYSGVMYVEELIGPNTVNTVPVQTLDAYRDHGKPAARLEQNIEESQLVLQELKELGIDLKSVSEKLEDEGIQKFVQSFDHLLQVIDQKRLEVAL